MVAVSAESTVALIFSILDTFTSELVVNTSLLLSADGSLVLEIKRVDLGEGEAERVELDVGGAACANVS